MKKPPSRPLSGATLVLGLATGSLTLAAVIIGSRLVNVERTARRQDVEVAAIERAGSGARLAGQPLFAREGLRAVLRALPEAWLEGRAPSPTLLAGLAAAANESARSDAFVEGHGAVRCVGFAGDREFALTARGVLARRGGPRAQVGASDVARCVIAHERLALVSRAGEVEVWTLGETPARSAGWSSGITEPWAVALAANGTLVAVTARQREIRVWSSRGELRRSVTLPAGTLDALAFSPDGRRLAVGGGDGAVRLLSVADPPALQEDRTLTGHISGVTALVWRRDGERLVSGGRDRLALIWNASTGEVAARCEGARGAIHAIAVSAEGARVVTVGAEGVARVHDGAGGGLLLTLPVATGSLHAVTFGGGGRWIAAAGDDGVGRRWETDTGASLGERALSSAPVWHLAASPTEPRLLAGDEEGRASWWAAEGDASRAVMTAHREGVGAVAVAPTGDVFTGDDGGDIYRWSAATGRMITFLEGHEDRVRALAVTADGQRVVSVSHDGGARVWAGDGRYLHALRGHVGWVTALAVSPDGRFAVTGGNDGTIRRWSLGDGRAAGVSPGDATSITALAYTRDGAQVVAGDARGRTRLLDGEGLAPRRVLTERGAAVSSIALSRNGLGVLVGDAGGQVRLLDLATGRALATLRAPGQPPVTHVSFSPDGRSVLVADEAGGADIWNATSLRHVARVDGARRAVRASFSPDGSLVATASDDGAVRLHLSQSGDLLASWRPFRGAARAVRFTADGWLIATGEGGPARVYPASPDAFVARACELLGADADRAARAACAARSPVRATRP